MGRINDYLNETGMFFMATVDGDRPRLRPLGAHIEMDGKVIFGVGDFKDVYRQMLANPHVEIAACKKDGHWLRYSGVAVFETDPRYAEALLEALPRLRSIYNEQTGNRLMAFHLDGATAVDIPVMGKGTNLL